MLLRLTLLLFTVSIYAQAKPPNGRVAVIFESGYDGQSIWIHRLREAREFYEDRGYQVIILSEQSASDGRPTAGELQRVLQNVQGATDLQLEFVGHGSIRNPGSPFTDGRPLDAKRFPPQSIVDHIRNSTTLSGESITGQSQFAIISNVEPADHNSVGMNDLRDAIKSAQSSNPGLRTTVYALNCYSGHIPMALQDLPRVQSFSSTLASSVAMSIPISGSDNPQDFPRLFQEELSRGRTYWESFIRSQQRFFELSESSGNEFLRGPPRSQSQEIVSAWCVQNPEAPSQAAPPSDCKCSPQATSLVDSIKAIRDLVENVPLQNVRRASELALQKFERYKVQGLCNSQVTGQIDAILNSLRNRLNTLDRAAIDQLRQQIRSADLNPTITAYRENLNDEQRRLESEISKAAPTPTPSPSPVENVREELIEIREDPNWRRSRIEQIAQALEKTLSSRSAFERMKQRALKQVPQSLVEYADTNALSPWVGMTAKQLNDRVRRENDRCAEQNPTGAHLNLSVTPSQLSTRIEREMKCILRINNPVVRARVVGDRLFWLSRANVDSERGLCQFLNQRIEAMKSEISCSNRFAVQADRATKDRLNSQMEQGDEKIGK